MNPSITFTAQDFDIFAIDGLEERMSALKAQIRPKLERLGSTLAPQLSEILGQEMYIHVAKHARRTVNPPNDTWVAWSSDKRGYKKHPHFQVGLWQTHLFVWFALIYESPFKVDFAKQALPELDLIQQTIPADFVWSVDHMQPQASTHAELTSADFVEMLKRLQKVKKAEILCGLHLTRDEPILQNEKQLLQKIRQTFEVLTPLYHLAQPR